MGRAGDCTGARRARWPAKSKRVIIRRPTLSSIASIATVYVRPRPDGSNKPRGIESGEKALTPLNAYEHADHLHLSAAGRQELLYVIVSLATKPFFVMVGDHKSFDDGKLAPKPSPRYALLTVAERSRAVIRLRAHAAPCASNNLLQRHGPLRRSSHVGGAHRHRRAALSSAGNFAISHNGTADRMVELIEKLDPAIEDEPRSARTWFEQNGKTYPAISAFEWMVEYV